HLGGVARVTATAAVLGAAAVHAMRGHEHRTGKCARQADRGRRRAGLDLGAITPEEIAMTILGEIHGGTKARAARSLAPHVAPAHDSKPTRGSLSGQGECERWRESLMTLAVL